MTVTIRTLQQYRAEQKKFSVLTSYDACFARLISEAGIDVMLVGDSLGNVLQGRDSTLPVTLEDMAYHTACVARGNQGSLIMADVPFMAAATLERALASAEALMRAGANMVKFEGAGWLAETVTTLKRNGVPVCVHLGLTPQSVNAFGGFRVQGKDDNSARQLIEDAVALEQAGADVILLECVPRNVTARLCKEVSVPVIGIGAAPECDGQVLVVHDMLGITGGKTPRFVKNFMAEAGGDIQAAIRAFDQAVKDGSFPQDEHCF
jgi:3-methyl-2-oxobutanoate hydroxymethyltransferase